MVMLTGIKAFESRWQSLQAKYPISASQKQLVTRAMGRLVDNYATQEEIEAELPTALKIIFQRLVDAYLNGCWIDAAVRSTRETPQKPAPAMTPAMLAAAQLRQRQRQEPTAASEADTYIVNDGTEATIQHFRSKVVYA